MIILLQNCDTSHSTDSYGTILEFVFAKVESRMETWKKIAWGLSFLWLGGLIIGTAWGLTALIGLGVIWAVAFIFRKNLNSKFGD